MSFGVSVASQQTLFIVSGSPSNLILGEVIYAMMGSYKSWGVIIVLGVTKAVVKVKSALLHSR